MRKLAAFVFSLLTLKKVEVEYEKCEYEFTDLVKAKEWATKHFKDSIYGPTFAMRTFIRQGVETYGFNTWEMY